MVVALAAGLSTLTWWDAKVRTVSGPVVPDLSSSERVVAGRSVYDAHCAACHGVQLERQANWRERLPSGRLPAPPHHDAGHTWHHPFEVLFAITRNGLVPPLAPEGYESDMPGFGNRLSNDEIWNVLSYIRSRWSEKIRAAPDELQRQHIAQSRR